MGHLACIDLRTEWDILDASGPVPLFQCVLLEEASMRDPPLCHECFRACAALAARHSAFYYQKLFPSIPPTGDKSGWNSDYSPPEGYWRKQEMAE